LWERVDPDEPDLGYFHLMVGKKRAPKKQEG